MTRLEAIEAAMTASAMSILLTPRERIEVTVHLAEIQELLEAHNLLESEAD